MPRVRWRPDIVNAGSWETGYSECRVWGDQIYECRVRGRPDIVNAGSWETRYSECRVPGREDIVNAGSRRDQI
ncbi:unnamed protein product [Staurois parvus]|uniref:Uncharacterized protein n=1 Tax=Staurois parvus TaxID=386267 RepID=A0ABN9GHY4_9NEOB|nr:unnamed protein product [Staurois parvus]